MIMQNLNTNAAEFFMTLNQIAIALGGYYEGGVSAEDTLAQIDLLIAELVKTISSEQKSN